MYIDSKGTKDISEKNEIPFPPAPSQAVLFPKGDLLPEMCYSDTVYIYKYLFCN